MRWPVMKPLLCPRHPACSPAGESEAADRTSVSVRDLLDVFTPARPKIGARLLTGRRAELDRILSAVTDERCHVVLYSKRGRGKTSLANAAVEELRSRGVVVARYTCHSSSSFQEIMRGLLRGLPGSLLAVSAERQRGIGCEAALPNDSLTLADLVSVPSRLTCQKLVFVVDEFDRVEDGAARNQFADAIKHLSDCGSRLVFVLIGVSDNLDSLIGRHESIRRNIIPLALPLLTRDEVKTMVRSGAKEAGFDIEDAVLDDIATLCGGIPYLAQSIALRTTQATRSRGGLVTSGADLCRGATRLIQEADPGVVQRYEDLTSQGGDRTMIRTLQMLAKAEQDCHGRLLAVHDQDLVEVSTGPIPVGVWRRLEAAGVISPSSSGGPNRVSIGDHDLLTYGLLFGIAQQSWPAEPTPLAALVQAEHLATTPTELAGTR